MTLMSMALLMGLAGSWRRTLKCCVHPLEVRGPNCERAKVRRGKDKVLEPCTGIAVKWTDGDLF